MSTLEDLRNRIAVVRSKERNVVLLSGLSKSVMSIILVVLAYFMIDWLFDLPFAARLFAAAVGLSAIGYVIYKHLVLELRKILDDDEIALRIEARNPDLRNRLISTLQLTRAGKGGAFVGSQELLNALEEETIRLSDPLDFSKIINSEMMIRFGIAAILLIAVKTALVAKFPGYFAALGSRLVHAGATYPTKTKIERVKVPEYVPRGEDIPVEVFLDKTGVDPLTPRFLDFRSIVKDSSVPVDLVAAEPWRYTASLTKAIEDVDLIVNIGDARSLPIRIKVLPRPEVDVPGSGGCIQYKWPAYTHMPDPAPEKFGGLSALSGSVANIRFMPTKPLKSAVIECADGRKVPLDKKMMRTESVEKGQKVTTDTEWWGKDGFPIDKNGSFHVLLTDLDGLTNIQPSIEYPIDARPDMPPSIRLMRPRKDATVTPTARINVGFQARDDYGIRVIWLVYRVLTEGQSEGAGTIKPERIERLVEAEKGRLPTDLSKTFAWDLSTLKVQDRALKPGDQIIFWFEADDECALNDMPTSHTRKVADGSPDQPEVKGPVYTRSADIKLSVISREDKARELEAEVQRLYTILERQKDNQQEIKTKVREMLEEIEKMKKPD